MLDDEAAPLEGSEERKVLVSEIDKSARSTLKVSATMPLIMAFFFIGVILYYRSKGGYKPIEL